MMTAKSVKFLRLYLENAAFTVLDAENGVTALLLFQQSQPDLVILDIMMPVWMVWRLPGKSANWPLHRSSVNGAGGRR